MQINFFRGPVEARSQTEGALLESLPVRAVLQLRLLELADNGIPVRQ